MIHMRIRFFAGVLQFFPFLEVSHFWYDTECLDLVPSLFFSLHAMVLVKTQGGTHFFPLDLCSPFAQGRDFKSFTFMDFSSTLN